MIEVAQESRWRRWPTKEKFNQMKNLLLDLMNVGADALTDGFELALEQVRCVLPDLDLSQFSIYHEVVDGKLIPPAP